jgi:hypothetical protein
MSFIEKVNFSNTEVFGFNAALRGMRNPMNSWDRGDSVCRSDVIPAIGPNDLKLVLSLIKAGSEHRKFLRSIVIWTDIEAPRYVWQELDTYKVSTVRNSCSTMHKLGSRDLVLEDFSGGVVMTEVLERLNLLALEYRNAKFLRAECLKTDGKVDNLQRRMKQLLPEGFLQKATYTMNYETALTMFNQRRKHRLPEWKFVEEDSHKEAVLSIQDTDTSICNWIFSLPYMKTIIQYLESSK